MPSAPVLNTDGTTSGSGSTNKITRHPYCFAVATAAFTARNSPAWSFQPSPEVRTSGPSGTRVHCSGLTLRTMSKKRSSGLPSIFSSNWGRHGCISSANSNTSVRRICRSSGRGWTVMPSAPASCASAANRNTLGTAVRREFRRRATLFRLTLRRGIGEFLPRALIMHQTSLMRSAYNHSNISCTVLVRKKARGLLPLIANSAELMRQGIAEQAADT